jgi:hypothetical protein
MDVVTSCAVAAEAVEHQRFRGEEEEAAVVVEHQGFQEEEEVVVVEHQGFRQEEEAAEEEVVEEEEHQMRAEVEVEVEVEAVVEERHQMQGAEEEGGGEAREQGTKARSCPQEYVHLWRDPNYLDWHIQVQPMSCCQTWPGRIEFSQSH